MTDTTHRNHAFDTVKQSPLDYDAIVVLSGDGLVHEVFNGLARHSEPMRALKIPVAPVPTGSGNAMCLNLFGVKVRYYGTLLPQNLTGSQEGFDVVLAALNIVKGEFPRFTVDLCI